MDPWTKTELEIEMPYIESKDRFAIIMGETPKNAGGLNFLITSVAIDAGLPFTLKEYIKDHGTNYQTFNDIFGAWNGALLEMIRREFPEYGAREDLKCKENGDVY